MAKITAEKARVLEENNSLGHRLAQLEQQRRVATEKFSAETKHREEAESQKMQLSGQYQGLVQTVNLLSERLLTKISLLSKGLRWHR